MAADIVSSTAAPACAAAGQHPLLTPPQREFCKELWTTTSEWGRGLGLCAAGAALLQGALAAFPVMVWWGIPVSVPVSAAAIAVVGLRAAPQWGPVFGACVGLLVDASGPALLGATAWAYLPVAAAFTFLHRHLRRDHPVTLVLYTVAQAFVQTVGTYIAMRLGHLSGTPGHVAAATVFFTCSMGLLLAGVVAIVLHSYAALSRQLRRDA